MAHRTPNRLNEVTPPAPRSLVARLASRIAYLVASQLVLALPVGSAQTMESSQNWKAAIAEIDQLASAELAKQNVGGCTIGVVVDGDLVFAKSYGVADIEANAPATNDHVYRIGSITKQITGLMLLQLAESGDVRLSDPVKNYLPEIRNVQNRFERSPPITSNTACSRLRPVSATMMPTIGTNVPTMTRNHFIRLRRFAKKMNNATRHAATTARNQTLILRACSSAMNRSTGIA